MNMLHNSYQASAPGTLMLTGEHAVLYGYPALVCAIDQRITVTLIPRIDHQITIRSTALGDYQTTVGDLTPTPPFTFVLTAINHHQPHLPSGFDLLIDSEFSHQVGLGSSAAVTVATLAVLAQWQGFSLTLSDLYQQAYQVIFSVQQSGSGADVAASIYGGVIFYQKNPLLCQKLEHTFPISLIYSGNKKPTPVVIAEVKARYGQQPEQYEKLFHAMGRCTEDARSAIAEKNWVLLGDILNRHQQLQVALGVSTPIIERIIAGLLTQNTIQGAKISGAGLGDCVLALGNLPNDLFPCDAQQTQAGVRQLPVKIATKGMSYGRDNY